MSDSALDITYLEPEKGIADTLAQDFTVEELRAEVLEEARDNLLGKEDVVVGQFSRGDVSDQGFRERELIHLLMAFDKMEEENRRLRLENASKSNGGGGEGGSENYPHQIFSGVFGRLF